MKVIAHRGASGERPENTLSAYRLAVAQRADMIEIDLHRTRDGAIPITHDATLEHLGGRGEIADATLAQVRALETADVAALTTAQIVALGTAQASALTSAQLAALIEGLDWTRVREVEARTPQAVQ